MKEIILKDHQSLEKRKILLSSKIEKFQTSLKMFKYTKDAEINYILNKDKKKHSPLNKLPLYNKPNTANPNINNEKNIIKSNKVIYNSNKFLSPKHRLKSITANTELVKQSQIENLQDIKSKTSSNFFKHSDTKSFDINQPRESLKSSTSKDPLKAFKTLKSLHSIQSLESYRSELKRKEKEKVEKSFRREETIKAFTKERKDAKDNSSDNEHSNSILKNTNLIEDMEKSINKTSGYKKLIDSNTLYKFSKVSNKDNIIKDHKKQKENWQVLKNARKTFQRRFEEKLEEHKKKIQRNPEHEGI